MANHNPTNPTASAAQQGAQHTPGPWELHSGRANTAPGSPVEFEIRGGNHVVVRLGRLSHERQFANARLIAAAPMLLEAAKAALQALAIVGNADPECDQLRAAIAAATGGEG